MSWIKFMQSVSFKLRPSRDYSNRDGRFFLFWIDLDLDSDLLTTHCHRIMLVGWNFGYLLWKLLIGLDRIWSLVSHGVGGKSGSVVCTACTSKWDGTVQISRSSGWTSTLPLLILFLPGIDDVWSDWITTQLSILTPTFVPHSGPDSSGSIQTGSIRINRDFGWHGWWMGWISDQTDRF